MPVVIKRREKLRKTYRPHMTNDDLRKKLVQSRVMLDGELQQTRKLVDALLAEVEATDGGTTELSVLAPLLISALAALESKVDRIGRRQSEEWVHAGVVGDHVGGWSAVAVNRLARAGKLPGVEIRPGTWLYRISMVDEYLDLQAAAQVGWGRNVQSAQSRGRKRKPG